ncbi:hypothetical protein L227DRAFT_574462 [Lentinus tigrinus ALCF2SS1-6]|uniref:Ubiquitin 3 binding protein But2 C-terminal domain-containing protein n=1 Tax=Lentinus tigrinus ALCF2SS1-6 TaxID=1328759 RepID=A0A5C2SC60_9APHY|nr:hypothetical protein L227DRAFT_574462 [Lentinus tigrinus ALCF2SS1-6]
MSLPTYTPLPSEPLHPVHVEPLEFEDEDFARPSQGSTAGWLSVQTARKFFISSCILSLAISATNLSYLSGSTALYMLGKQGPHMRATKLKRPSVYVGLENVPRDPSRCRSRVGYPGMVYTYDARDPGAVLTRVHGPNDNVTLTFGGPIRAVMDMYIADYGLEDCTLSLRGPKEQVATVKIDTYLVLSPGAGSNDAEFLDTLVFTSGEESYSRPFHCDSGRQVWTEWRCEEEGCVVRMPLQAVTRRSESSRGVPFQTCGH